MRRWKGGCDCGREDSFNLNWRLPFRAALNSLRDAAADIYSAEGAKFFRAPWETRNDYVSLMLDRSGGTRDAFFEKHSRRPLEKAEKTRALELLEMQRHAMFMFTSCGWFFSDISRIEAVQNLRYAARAAETMRELGFENADRGFMSLLEMAHSNYPEAGDGLKLYHKILSENAMARQKAAALLIAETTLCGDEPPTEGSVRSEERMNRDGVLYLRGKVPAPGPEEPSHFSFCYLRRDEEFPLMFFSGSGGSARFGEIFALGEPAAILAALEKEPGTARVTFDDFSWEERTLYAWMLADAAKRSHSAAIFKILDDYLYLLARLPGRALASWAPLRGQAAIYARQAAEIVFARSLRSGSPGEIEKLAVLAARIKAAGLEAGFDPYPEAASTLALNTAAAAISSPSAQTLAPLVNLLKAARALGAHDLMFHLQNCLADLFASAEKNALPPDTAASVKELYSLSGLIIERFNSRLEEMAAKK